MTPFDGHVVIVTGASEGIGRALSQALAAERAKLVLAARNAERLEETARACRERGAETLVVPTDVTREDDCRSLVARAVERFGRLDGLVNNAGATMWAQFEDVTDLSIFERLMRVNYLGSVYCTYFALPRLKETRGRLVAIASVSGLTGVPARTGYCASKHAVVGFFDALRVELAGSGVTVTIVAPDFVRSETHRRALGSEGKPLGTSPTQEGKLMTAEACAALILKGMRRRQRLVVTTARGRQIRWLKLLAPEVLDRFTARAIRRGR